MMTICKEHNITHEKEKDREHIFEKLGTKFNIKEVNIVIKNLSSKLKSTKNAKS